MVFHICFCLWILVSEYEMDLVGCPTFIGPKHDRVWGLIIEMLGHPASILWLQKLEVSTSTLQSVLQPKVILQHNSVPFQLDGLGKFSCYAILACLLADKKPIIFMSLAFLMFPNSCSYILYDVRNSMEQFKTYSSIQYHPCKDTCAYQSIMIQTQDPLEQMARNVIIPTKDSLAP